MDVDGLGMGLLDSVGMMQSVWIFGDALYFQSHVC